MADGPKVRRASSGLGVGSKAAKRFMASGNKILNQHGEHRKNIASKIKAHANR